MKNLSKSDLRNLAKLLKDDRPKELISFQDFTGKYERTVLPSFKPSTQQTTRSYLIRLNQDFGDMILPDISGEVVQRWVSGQKSAPKTVRNLVGQMSSMWAKARAWGYALHDPFESITLPAPVLVEKPCLTAEQARSIIRASDEPYRAMFWVVAETGMRGGEVCGLFVNDVDFARGLIHVRRSAWKGKLQTPKTGNAVRTFAISPELSEHLKEFIKASDGLCTDPYKLLFHTSDGCPMNNEQIVARVFKPLCRKLGFDGHRVGLHALRHGSASALDSLGVPMSVRQERLGHADASTTMGYTHALGQDHRRAAEALGKLFCPHTESVQAGGGASQEEE